MRRKTALTRMFILLAAVIYACQAATQPSRPVATRRATFTPLVVNTAMPPPSQIPRPTHTLLPLADEVMLPVGSTAESEAEPKALHFILVQHTRCAWEPSWCPLEQGVLDAARELSVTVTLWSPEMPAGDRPADGDQTEEGNVSARVDYSLAMLQTAELIDRAVAARPDGLAITISDPHLLRTPVWNALEAGIPVIAYHDGAGPIQDELPYLTYLGMDNYESGYRGAQRLIQAGARAGACLNPYPALAALQTRCNGFHAAFNQAGLKSDIVAIASDATQAQQELQAYAQAHAEVDAYLTTDAGSARVFYAYLQASGRAAGEILHGATDIDSEIRQHIESGETLFGTDQQFYLQGYEAVFWLTMIARFGFTPASPVTATGPHFIDRANLNALVDPARPVRLIFIQHALCTWDEYWCVVERGIYQAAREREVQVEIWGPDSFNLDEMNALIFKAVVASPDGIGVTLPDSAALHAAVRRALQVGYPVVVYDSGSGPEKDGLDYLTFIGVTMEAEYRGGYRAAQRLIQGGGRAGVCVNHQIGHAALDARCQGMIDAFAVEGLAAEVLDCGGEPEQAVAIIQEFAQTHPQVNAYLTMGPGEPGAMSLYRYLETSPRLPGEVLHGTFDLGPAVVTAIEEGTSLFAVDGQPYLQGYRAVMFLTLALRQNIWPAENITPTGPGFIDRSNITLVKQLAGTYR